MIFDTHAHYDDEQFDKDRDALLQSLTEHGIEAAVDVSASYASCEQAVALAKKYDAIYAAVGIHPDHAGELNEERLAMIEALATEKKVVAIGEIGLDYYWDIVDHEVQKYWFKRQLEVAERVKLPVIIHSREAAQDTFDILKDYKGEKRGVIHCYSGSLEMAKEYVKRGFFLGIGGVVTFKNAKVIKEVVEGIDLSWLVLETDCPYLAPVPYRGKRNSSLYLPYVAEQIAQIKGIDVDEVIRVTCENAKRLYQL